MFFTNGLKNLNNDLSRLEALLGYISTPSRYGVNANNVSPEMELGRDIAEVEEILKSLDTQFGGISTKTYNKQKVMDACRRWDKLVGEYNSAKVNCANYFKRSGYTMDVEKSFSRANQSADNIATTSKHLQTHYSPKVSRTRVAAATLAVVFGLGFGSLALKNGVENSKITQSYNELQGDYSILQKDKTELANLYEGVLAERDSLQDKLDNAKTQEEYDAIKSQLDEKDAKIAELVEQLENAKGDEFYKNLWQISLKAYSELSEDYNALSDKNAELEKSLEEAVKKSDQLGIDLTNLEAKYGNLYTKYTQLSKDYQLALANAKELSDTINTLTAENNALKLENEMLQALIDSGKVDDSLVAQYIQRIRELEAKNAELENLLEAKAGELATANAKIEELNGKLATANKEKADLVAELGGLKQENADLKDEIKGKDAIIADLKAQLKSDTSGSLRNDCIKIIIDEVGISAKDANNLSDEQIAEYLYYLVGGKVPGSSYGPNSGSVDSNEKDNTTGSGSGSSESKGDGAYEGNSGTPSVKEDNNTIGNDNEYENGEGSPYGPNSGNPGGQEDNSGNKNDDKNNGDIFVKE